jgi:hypothetical protein
MSIADRFTGPGDDPAMSKLALELRRSVIAESNLVAVADRTTALNLDLLESIRALGSTRPARGSPTRPASPAPIASRRSTASSATSPHN